MKLSLRLLIAGTGVLALSAVGCSSRPIGDRVGPPPRRPVAQAGRLGRGHLGRRGRRAAALIAAARKEGTLNVIALPPTWANYGTIIKTFSKRYGIKVNSISPGARSAQEIAEVTRDHGSAQAADVLDIEMSDAVAHSKLFAPYRVATWQAIPAGQKAADGSWVEDYGGFMSIGYNSARFGKITSIGQLLGPRFARAVALDGNPARGQGGALRGHDGQPRARRDAGQHRARRDVLPQTQGGGQLRRGAGHDGADDRGRQHAGGVQLGLPEHRGDRRPAGADPGSVFIPPGAAVGVFNAQAINKDAPHPAAARLWEEFLYSAGQARRPEPVAGGRRPPCRAGGNGRERHGRPGGLAIPAAGSVKSGVPDARTGRTRGRVPARQLVEGRWLIVASVWPRA